MTVSTLWTTVDDVVQAMRKRWPRYLRAYAAGESWQHVAVVVRGPKAAELLDNLDAATKWSTRFERDAAALGLCVERRALRSRHLGNNEVPARVIFETFAELCQLLGTTQQVTDFDTAARPQELMEWITRNPESVIEHRDNWDKMLSVVDWIMRNDRPQFLRQVEIPGIDTKFIEANQKTLRSMLETVLPEERINRNRSDFGGRFGFLVKTNYVRVRLLDSVQEIPSSVTELTFRVDELGDLPLDVDRVFIVENEITFLAFPEVVRSMVIFGSGFAVDVLKSVEWLKNKQLVYWGDIDTHGFVMLSRLRAIFPHVESMLMDELTLIAYQDAWVTEPVQTNAMLDHLTPSEANLYRDLVENRFGDRIRLEQERVPLSAAIMHLGPGVQ